MKQIAPQINELCEEVMSQSLIERLHEQACACRHVGMYQGEKDCYEAAAELTRLSAEKAELHTALLQAREDAQRYRWLRALTTWRSLGPIHWLRIPELTAPDGPRDGTAPDKLDAAIDAARQAEPQEGEKG